MKDRGSPNQSSKRKELKEQERNNIQRDNVYSFPDLMKDINSWIIL